MKRIVMKDRCFGDVFAEKREELCPEVNGGFERTMLRGVIHKSAERVEVIWDDRPSVGPAVHQLRRAFGEALNTLASEAQTHIALEPVMGHVAIRPLMQQVDFVSTLQEQAYLRPFQAD